MSVKGLVGLLRALREGGTLGEVSRATGIPLQDLRGRLEMLRHMGYVERVEGAWKGCASCHSCASRGCCDAIYYRITEKGRRVIEP